MPFPSSPPSARGQLHGSAFEHTRVSEISGKQTDDVSGAARPATGEAREGLLPDEDELEGGSAERALAEDDDAGPQPPPPPQVADLAAACVRFVATRYGAPLDFAPETLSFVDHCVREARAEIVV